MTPRLLGSLAIVFALLATINRSWAQDAPIDPEPRLSFQFSPTMRFGLRVLKTAAGKPVNKQLTYSSDGATSSTVLKIDGKELDFGSAAGKFLDKESRFLNGAKRTWAVHGVEITQILEIVPSKQPIEVNGVRKRFLDTCLIRYEIENKDGQHHDVGLRVQVDTLIGGNDGVPFAVPTLPGLVNTFKDFVTSKGVPDFVQALEVPNLQNPGTIGHMTLKLGGHLEVPSRVSLTRWPGFNFVKWEVPVAHMDKDSAVVIYWNPVAVNSQARRSLGFAYGLGSVSAGDGTGKLALTVNGTFKATEPFTVTAYVQNPTPGQSLTLELPNGLERVDGKTTEAVPQPLKGDKGTSTITWKVAAPNAGQFVLKVRSSSGDSQSQSVTIAARPNLDGGKLLSLAVSSPLALNQAFTLTASVKHPLPSQQLTLELPAGLDRLEGRETEAVPPHGDKDFSTVAWKIIAAKPGEFVMKVRSSTGDSLLQSVKFEASAPTGGKLVALVVSGPVALNQTFTLTATVKNPLPDQNLTLALPEGLLRMEGEETQLAPPLPANKTEGDSAVVWKVKAVKTGTFTVHVRSSSDGMLSKDITIPEPKNLNVLDARRALQMSVGILKQELSHDVDNDGRVTSRDAALILQRVAEQTRQGK